MQSRRETDRKTAWCRSLLAAALMAILVAPGSGQAADRKKSQGKKATARKSTAGKSATRRRGAPEAALTGSAREIVDYTNSQIKQGWTDNEIKPSALASDAEWIRRVHLDLVGAIPSLETVEAFLKDRDTPCLLYTSPSPRD